MEPKVITVETSRQRPRNPLQWSGQRSQWLSGNGNLGIEVAVVVVCALVVLGISWADAYWESLILQGIIFALLAQALNLIAGYGGRLAFGNGLFFGFGAYAVALGNAHGWYPEIVGLVIGIAGSALIAYGLGLGLSKLTGLMFALVTFALASMVAELAGLPNWTGGSAGLALIVPQQVSIVHISLSSQFQYVVAGVILVVITGFATRAFARRKAGVIAMAIRDESVAAATCGVNGPQYLARVWAVSAGLSAVAGALFVQSTQFIDPPTAFGFTTGTQILLVLIVGGIGTVWGPALGAVVVPLSGYLDRFSSPNGVQGISDMVYAVILVLIVRLLPQGITPWLRDVGGWLRRRSAGDTGAVTDDAAQSPEAGLAATAAGAVPRAGAVALAPDGAGGPAGPDQDAGRLALAELVTAELVTAEAGPASRRQRPDGAGPVLTLRNVAKSFGGAKAVRDVSLELSAGEIVGLVGPNGAGKSTLFNCVTGVERPNGGSISFKGREIAGLPPYKIARLGISRTFQTVRLFPTLSVRQNVLVPAYARGADDDSFEASMDATLRAVGLADLAEVDVGRLPLIDQRRVELARAIAGGGTLVLLDEVLTGLQHEEAVEIGRVIRSVSADLGTAFIVVEHVMGTLMPIIDRLVVMDAGAVIADGIPDEVIRMRDVEVAYFGRGVNDGR
jgi:branched-chain amino acid transport system permease protein